MAELDFSMVLKRAESLRHAANTPGGIDGDVSESASSVDGSAAAKRVRFLKGCQREQLKAPNAHDEDSESNEEEDDDVVGVQIYLLVFSFLICVPVGCTCCHIRQEPQNGMLCLSFFIMRFASVSDNCL
jgi:hypothetical protein